MVKLMTGIVAGVLVLGIALGCSGENETSATESVGTTREKPMATRIAEADQAFRNRQYSEAGRMFEEIAESAEAEGNDVAFVEAAAMRARSYLIEGDAESGRPWLARAEEKADTTAAAGWSRYLGVRGRFERENGDEETATKTFLEMFEYCSAHGLYDRAVDAAHMIAITGDPSEKLEWARRGIEMAEKGNMIGWLGPLWNNLGWDYVDAGQYDDAIEALRNARDYHYMGTAEIPKLIADYSVAHVLRLKGELEESRTAMTDVFERAQELREGGNPDAVEWIGFSRWELGELAIAEGDAADGVPMMREALGELEQAGMPAWDASDWEKRNARVEELER